MSKNIIVTGASGNLGKATVERFLKDGHQVIATVSPGKQLGYSVEGKIEVVQVDLTNEASALEMVESVRSRYGVIDCAVLLVGAFNAGGVQEADGLSIKKMYALNFETAYYVARPVFMYMMQQHLGGRMVLIGSRPALNPEEGKEVLAYALAKSLLFQLADYFNEAGRGKNVVTSVVVPGTIDTPANRQPGTPANGAYWVKAAEVADTIAYLVDDQARSLVQPIVKIYGNG
ncbi:MAG: SDR family NAD(P)-dependent oxidoreductase [Bacteroidota bacterium]